jgi:glycosyltransferase involved in cell wall biosynthesis
MLEKITPLILTYNESPNITRTLNQLTWAKNIIVIDSFSDDNTLDLLKQYPQVQIYQRKFDNFADQWNYGLNQITSEWVLSLDADYILSDELINELKSLSENSHIDSYFVRFKYCIFGKPLRGTLYPPREVLYRKSQGIYYNDGHTQKALVKGNSTMLTSYIYHDDRKPLSMWLNAQNKYMIIESEQILSTPNNQLTFSDKLRKYKVIAPFLVLFYCLIINQGILDGWAGLYYAFQRTLAEILLSIHLIKNEKLLK